MEQDEEWFGLVSSFDAECGIGTAVHGERKMNDWTFGLNIKAAI